MIHKVSNQDWVKIAKDAKLGDILSFIADNKISYMEKLEDDTLTQEDAHKNTMKLIMKDKNGLRDEYTFDTTGLVSFTKNGKFYDASTPESLFELNARQLNFILSTNLVLAKHMLPKDKTHQLFIRMDIDAFLKRTKYKGQMRDLENTLKYLSGKKRTKAQEEEYKNAKYIYDKSEGFVEILDNYRDILDEIQTQSAASQTNEK